VGSLVTDATAVLPDDWDGEFNLSHVDCQEPVKPEISTEIHLEPGDTAIADPFEVALGSSVHDSATATGPEALGDPTGDIDFTFYKGACGDDSNLLFTTLDVPLVDGVAHPSDSSGALGAGEYHFQAHYDSDNEAVWADSDSLCEPLTVNKAQLEIVTQIHDAGHNAVGDAVHVPLGSVVHDTATVTGAVDGFPIGAISFTLNGNGPVGQVAAEAGYSATTEDSAPLAAGSYTYKGYVEGNDNYIGGDSGDEPLTVDKAQLTIVTAIHNSSHNDITNTTVPVGTVVHDTATVTGAVPGFDPTGAISFTLNTNPVANADPAEAGYSASTVDSDPLAAGSYIYKANVAGDDNYFGDDSPDEPLSVRTLGKTMGFWGNPNGQALLPANPNVTLGSVSATTCSIVVNTKAISKVILPNTLNGVSILTNCTTSGSRDAGINVGSLNNLLAQTLAISFNILYINGYTGQTVGGLGCTATGIAALSPLTNASTVQAVRDQANYLIANAKSGAPIITQAQIGAMNTLLGCLNREV
jgi:hypothetical protein